MANRVAYYNCKSDCKAYLQIGLQIIIVNKNVINKLIIKRLIKLLIILQALQLFITAGAGGALSWTAKTPTGMSRPR